MKLTWEHKTKRSVPLHDYWEAAISKAPYLYTVEPETVDGRAGSKWRALAKSWASTGHATADDAKAAAQKHWDAQAKS
jgi:hypothetical protein